MTDNNITITGSAFVTGLPCGDSEPTTMRRAAEELIVRNFIGMVTFDMLITNGHEPNRFIQGVFDGTWFDTKSFKVVTPAASIIDRQNQFFRDNPEMLQNSVLSTEAVAEMLEPETA